MRTINRKAETHIHTYTHTHTNTHTHTYTHTWRNGHNPMGIGEILQNFKLP